MAGTKVRKSTGYHTATCREIRLQIGYKIWAGTAVQIAGNVNVCSICKGGGATAVPLHLPAITPYARICPLWPILPEQFFAPT
jgi:hypothetical protein